MLFVLLFSTSIIINIGPDFFLVWRIISFIWLFLEILNVLNFAAWAIFSNFIILELVGWPPVDSCDLLSKI